MDNFRKKMERKIAAYHSGIALKDREADLATGDNGNSEETKHFDNTQSNKERLRAYLNSLSSDGADVFSQEPINTSAERTKDLLHTSENYGRDCGSFGNSEDFTSNQLFQNVATGKTSDKNQIRPNTPQKTSTYPSEYPIVSSMAKDDVRPEYDRDMEMWSVPAQAVFGLDVKIQHGDINIALNSQQNDLVAVDGDVGGLMVTLSEAGILNIREGHSLRGIAGRDVFLTLPNKSWNSIKITTTFGDIDITDRITVDKLNLHTGSGDIDCKVKSCNCGEFKTATSGDISCVGNWQSFQAESAGGDIDFEGNVFEAKATTVTGDVSLEGVVTNARIRSLSGDIEVISRVLPQDLNLSSKKGDIDVELPCSSPFHAKLSTMTGDVDNEFAQIWTSRFKKVGPIPQYVLSSISGDLSLTKIQ